MQPRRIVALDILRGLAIIALVVVHRIHYDWPGMAEPQLMRRYLSGVTAPIVGATVVVFMMAGIFYLLSGLVNAYSTYARVAARKGAATNVMQGALVTGLWFMLWNYIQRLFFMNGFVGASSGTEPKFPAGLLTGSLQGQGAAPFRWSQITEPGTLMAIGLIVIIVNVSVTALLTGDGVRQPQRVCRTLGWLGVAVLALSPIVKFWLMPIYATAYEARHYAVAWLLGPVCQEFSLFPYLGYGFLGAMVGIGLARREDLRLLRVRCGKIAAFLVAAGAVGILLADRRTALGQRVIGAGVSYVELAIFLVVTGWAIRFWDMSETAKVARRQRRFGAARRFGVVAFTVYVFEPLVARIVKSSIDAVAGGGWSVNLLFVVAFSFLCVAVWSALLWLWSRRQFAGSIEWLSAAVLRALVGKQSGKTAAFAAWRIQHDAAPQSVVDHPDGRIYGQPTMPFSPPGSRL